MVDSQDAPVEFFAAGWALMTPRLNPFKTLIRMNPSRFSIRAIVFPKRKVAAIEGIPVLEPDEVASLADASGSTPLWVNATINAGLQSELRAFAAARDHRFMDTADFLRLQLAEGSTDQHMPFDGIDHEDLAAYCAADAPVATERLLDIASIDTVRKLDRIFLRFRWEDLYDFSTVHTVQSLLIECIGSFMSRGVRLFTVADVSGDAIEVLLHLKGLHFAEAIEVSMSDETARVLGRRRLFYAASLQREPRVTASIAATAPVAADALLVAGSLPELMGQFEMFAGQAPQKSVHFIARLRRGVIDYHRLLAFMDRAKLSHRLQLRQSSANPDTLMVMGFCI